VIWGTDGRKNHSLVWSLRKPPKKKTLASTSLSPMPAFKPTTYSILLIYFSSGQPMRLSSYLLSMRCCAISARPSLLLFYMGLLHGTRMKLDSARSPTWAVYLFFTFVDVERAGSHDACQHHHDGIPVVAFTFRDAASTSESYIMRIITNSTIERIPLGE
jgi:hypothetical protein